MIILPAIDIIGGKAVRLYQGDYSKEEKINRDTIEIALEFENLGAEYIHLVDLDGAKNGTPVNHDIIIKLAKTLNIPVEVGGGIRSLETICNLLENGVSRVILGTVAIKDKNLLKKSLSLYGDKIAVGVDCKDGYVCTEGWLDTSEVHYIDFCKKLECLGVDNIILTDISKDGTLQGPNLDMLKALSKNVNVKITASGGVRDIDNIKDLKKLNIYGAITGKAIYSGKLNLEDAINTTKSI